jgi:hypothetical protein
MKALPILAALALAGCGNKSAAEKEWIAIQERQLAQIDAQIECRERRRMFEDAQGIIAEYWEGCHQMSDPDQPSRFKTQRDIETGVVSYFDYNGELVYQEAAHPSWDGVKEWKPGGEPHPIHEWSNECSSYQTGAEGCTDSVVEETPRKS